MRLTRRILVPLLVAAPCAPAAQGTMPGSHPSSISQQRAEYEAMARAHVDTLLDAWQAAIDARDAKRVAALYDEHAVIVLSSGRRLVGRAAIQRGYGNLFARMHSPTVSISKLIAGGGNARVSAILTFEVPQDSGGSYAYTTTVEFGLQATVTEAFEIRVQEGGDIETIVMVGDQPADLPPAHGDSLAVQVVDVTGAGIEGVAVTFEITGGHGAIAPSATLTDSRGIATAYFTAGAQPDLNAINATAATLPQEPVLFSNKTTAAP